MTRDRSIVALGGLGAAGGPLDEYVLGLTGRERPKACFLATAAGDTPAAVVLFYERFTAARCEPSHLELFGVPRADVATHLLAQDLIWVCGGNTANMLAVWRVHGVDAVLREAWEQGVVLAGWSAGAICWFEAGVTDSFGPELRPLQNAIGFLPGSFCPHYDGESERRPAFQRLVAGGELPAGYAADDAVGLLFSGTELVEAVTEREGAGAFRVELEDGGLRETSLVTRLL